MKNPDRFKHYYCFLLCFQFPCEKKVWISREFKMYYCTQTNHSCNCNIVSPPCLFSSLYSASLSNEDFPQFQVLLLPCTYSFLFGSDFQQLLFQQILFKISSFLTWLSYLYLSLQQLQNVHGRIFRKYLKINSAQFDCSSFFHKYLLSNAFPILLSNPIFY